MAVKLRIPTPLRSLSGGASELSVDGTTVAEALEALEHEHPGFRARIYDDSGEIRRFVNIYVSGEDIRFLDGVNTPVKDGEDVSIVPAVAGGG